ncbi:hypothetical protein [Dolichospermum sp. UHCC 0406]|uniref:hypothetical protein n=1 Tax=Dolichospermum sp. UHCC 0406 TaxID=2590017 RepID=UPI0014458F1F|nr:hypothetical protein [Dolichospermum sp. UHCC 0406]MTJ37918.1 hypothetical protein [Dolichospermum sp. UHCC 0406]
MGVNLDTSKGRSQESPSQESGVRSQESGVRSQESGGKKKEERRKKKEERRKKKEERRKKKEERRKFFYSLFPVPCSLTTRLNLILSCMAFTSSL